MTTQRCQDTHCGGPGKGEGMSLPIQQQYVITLTASNHAAAALVRSAIVCAVGEEV